MARFNTSGVDEVVAEMKRKGELAGPTAEKMLFAGAEEVKSAWKSAAEAYGFHSTGDMIESVGFPRTVNRSSDILSIDIYPQGKSSRFFKNGKTYKRKKPVRNAEKAFILHYGSGSIDASHWVDTADAMARPRVEVVMKQIWDDHLKGK
jgi:hypothetical protein